MILSVVVDNPRSWFIPFAQQLVQCLSAFGRTQLLQSADKIPLNNEVTFLLSCEKKVPPSLLARSRHNIVVHASDLPQGKGMSPLTWQILEGKDIIPVSLFEACENIDAGNIYVKDFLRFQGNELLNEMQSVLGAKIIELCEHFMREYPDIIAQGRLQAGPESLYRRRNPEDSRLDPHKTITEQFSLLRVVDNERFPAFFEWKGRKYVLKIAPVKD
jgi:methionyl-tRNA formyltransferase